MFFPLVILIWFGIAAKRAGKNVVLWALGGGTVALMLHLCAAVVVPWSVSSFGPWDEVRLRLIVTGASVITSLVVSRAIVDEFLSSKRFSPEAVRSVHDLLRSVGWRVLWIIPACFLMQFGGYAYYDVVRGVPLPEIDISYSGAAAALAEGFVFVLVLRSMRSVGTAAVSWGLGHAVILMLTNLFTTRTLLFEAPLGSGVGEAAFIASALVLMRTFGLRWWVWMIAGLVSSTLRSAAVLLLIAGGVYLGSIWLSSGYGAVHGLSVYCALWIVARLHGASQTVPGDSVVAH